MDDDIVLADLPFIKDLEDTLVHLLLKADSEPKSDIVDQIGTDKNGIYPN